MRFLESRSFPGRMPTQKNVFINATKSGSSKSYVLKCHLVEGLVCAWVLGDWCVITDNN